MGMGMAAFAAPEEDAKASEEIIDSTKTGSLTIYKYDYQAASKAGKLTAGEGGNYKEGTGEKDSAFETAMDGYGIQGVQFQAVKVAEPKTYTSPASSEGAAVVNAGVQVVYSVETGLAGIIGLADADAVTVDGVKCWTSTKINEAVGARIAESGDSTAVKNSLEAYATAADTSYLLNETDKDGMTAQTDMPVGLYVVIETKVPDQVMTTTDPFFVSIPSTTADGEKWNYDIVVYPKNQTDYPELVKKLREHQKDNSENEYTDTVSASIGDVIDYRIVSKLPKISSTATYLTKYTYVDTLSEGQNFNGDLKIDFYQDKEAASATAASLKEPDVSFEKDTDYTVKVNGMEITIEMTEEGLKKINEGAAASDNLTAGNNGKYSYMVVSYSAVLNEKAVLGDLGNENDVKLTFSRTNDTYSETLEDKTVVYSFGLDLLKKSKGTKAFDATKVQFTLYNQNTNEKENGYYVTARQVADAPGHYMVTGQAAKAGSAPTQDDGNTIFSPDKDGKLYIEGIEADTYQMTEIRTCDGYSLLREPVTFVINSKEEKISPTTLGYEGNDGQGNTVGNVDKAVVEVPVSGKESSSASVNGQKAGMDKDGSITGTSENAEVVLEVTNTQGFNLPKTGGAGIWALTIAGVLAGALGVYFLWPKKRKND